MTKEHKPVNEFGQTAKRHWETYRPTALAELDNPEEFFQELGDRVAQRIADLWPEMATAAAGESDGFVETMGRNRMAMAQARELVMAEEVFLTPEPGLEDAELPPLA